MPPTKRLNIKGFLLQTSSGHHVLLFSVVHTANDGQRVNELATKHSINKCPPGEDGLGQVPSW